MLCKYYMNGCCAYGESCHFSHDRRDAPSQVCDTAAVPVLLRGLLARSRPMRAVPIRAVPARRGGAHTRCAHLPRANNLCCYRFARII